MDEGFSRNGATPQRRNGRPSASLVFRCAAAPLREKCVSEVRNED
jgi:hypothetical protein